MTIDLALHNILSDMKYLTGLFLALLVFTACDNEFMDTPEVSLVDNASENPLISEAVAETAREFGKEMSRLKNQHPELLNRVLNGTQDTEEAMEIVDQSDFVDLDACLGALDMMRNYLSDSQADKVQLRNEYINGFRNEELQSDVQPDLQNAPASCAEEWTATNKEIELADGNMMMEVFEMGAAGFADALKATSVRADISRRNLQTFFDCID